MVDADGRGTSLVDSAGALPGPWWQFAIPSGTEFPVSNIVQFTSYNDKFAANHYQIEPKNPMTVEAFKGALDCFARNAVAKAYQNARK